MSFDQRGVTESRHLKICIRCTDDSYDDNASYWLLGDTEKVLRQVDEKKSIWDGRIGFFMSAWKDFLLISINFETNNKQKKVIDFY